MRAQIRTASEAIPIPWSLELIIINIGLQAAVVEPGLFSILVLMAIVTTLMATPLFNRVTRTPKPGMPGVRAAGSIGR